MNERNKERLKKILLRLTIFLSIFWIGLIGYGIFFERQIDLKQEKNNGQFYTLDITQPMENDIMAQPNIPQDLDEAIKEVKEIRNLPAASENKNEEVKINNKAKIALVVTNLGTNKNLTETALKFPNTITLGFSAYTTNLKDLYQQAIDSNFEVMIYMPFEPKDYPLSDPGPYAILTENSSEKNISIIRGILATFPGSKGIYGNYRESLSTNKKAFLPVVEFMKQKNLLVFLGRNIINDNPNYLDEFSNILSCDIIIDLIPDAEAIKHNLANLVSLAKNKKKAVGYINSYPVSLNILSQWVSSFNDQEVEIVPLSSLAEQ